MSLSASRDWIVVTEMGLKSDKAFGFGHFGIGVTIAVHQFVGTVLHLIEMLKKWTTISKRA